MDCLTFYDFLPVKYSLLLKLCLKSLFALRLNYYCGVVLAYKKKTECSLLSSATHMLQSLGKYEVKKRKKDGVQIVPRVYLQGITSMLW